MGIDGITYLAVQGKAYRNAQRLSRSVGCCALPDFCIKSGLMPGPLSDRGTWLASKNRGESLLEDHHQSVH
jgi:hypothetical protein